MLKNSLKLAQSLGFKINSVETYAMIIKYKMVDSFLAEYPSLIPVFRYTML
jgi:hypothetical protein